MPMSYSINSQKVICFNRIIDVDIYYYSSKDSQYKVLSVSTPRYGLKPDITVRLSVLPSNNVMGMTVSIRNMITDIDISKAYYMSVAMGYDSCGIALYRSIVFRSYQATPNPDGEFVFEGVVTGDSVEYLNDVSIIENDPLNVKWNDLGKISIASYVDVILNGYGNKKPKFIYKIDYQIDQSIRQKMSLSTIDVNKYHKSFSNPLSRAVYARQVLTEWGNNHNSPLVVVIEGNNFIVKSLQKDDTATPGQAIDIIGYLSASFNGALLTINTPYYPAINAGSLLRCDASYVTQTGPPNENGNNVKRNSSWSLYRVMKYSVVFSTVHENSMSIEAFPIKEAGKVTVDDNDESNSSSIGKTYIQQVLEHEYESKDNEGNPVIGDTVIDFNVVAAKRNRSASVFSSHSFKPINNLSGINDVMLLINDLYKGYYVKLEYPSNSGLSSKVFTVDCLFPLVYSLTWFKHTRDNTVADSPNEFPLSFTSGTVYLPTIPAIESNTVAVKSILNDFINIYSAYNDTHTYDNYIEAWKTMTALNVVQIRFVRAI